MEDDRYATGNTALMVIDVLNDFLADDGKLAGDIGPMLEKTDLKAHLRRLLAGARAAGIDIFYVPHGIDEHSFDDIPLVLPRMQFAIDNRIMWKGTYGAEFYPEFAPRPDDVVISRHRQFNGFIGTDLNERLQARGVEKVVLAGLTSHTCVEGTGRYAMESGYHVTFLTDAVAEFTEEAHRGAVTLSYPSFGHEVLTVDAFLARAGQAETV